MNYKIVEIHDTRIFDFETGKPIPGSGNPKPCDHCGKTHEIYVDIANSNNRMVVGTTCAQKLVYDRTGLSTGELKAAALRNAIRPLVEIFMERLSQVERGQRWQKENEIALSVVLDAGVNQGWAYKIVNHARML